MSDTERQDGIENEKSPIDIEREQIEQMMLEEEKMMRRAGMISMIIKVGVILILVAALAAGAWYFWGRNTDGEYSEYEAMMDRLAYQKQQLLVELDKLGPDMENQLGNTSYLTFLFSSLDSALYTSAYPTMASGDTPIAGMLALSPTELPGLEGKITEEQFETLINNKWGTALYWNGEGSLEEFITLMQTLLGEMEIEFPSTIVFKDKTYSITYDELLISYGLENAVHNGEGGLSIRIDCVPEGVWHPGVRGWKDQPRVTQLKTEVEEKGGYLLFEINFKFSNDNTVYSYFDKQGDTESSRFVTMIKLFKESVKDEKIEILATDEVRDKVETYYSELTDEEILYLQRRAEINAQINEVERQMTELYHEYHQGGK